MEKYSDKILKIRETRPTILDLFSTDYEGDATSGAVKVAVRDLQPSVRDYDVAEGIKLEKPTTTYKTLLVSKQKAINELIDGYEAQQVPDSIIASRLEAGAKALEREISKHAVSVLTNKENVTAYTTTTPTADNKAYFMILDVISALRKNGVEKEDMGIVVSPEFETKLLKDSNFGSSASNLSDEQRVQGFIGKISNILVATSDLGEDTEFVVFGKPWIQKAEAFKIEPEIKDLNDGVHIGASALQGRVVFDTFVTSKDAVIAKRNKA